MPTGQMDSIVRYVRKIALQDARSMSDAQLLESFITHQDESAFEALVTRHGPLVLSVCRRVLKNLHDAEDAFQATFLVLVRKAASLGKRELLANWLYGVAYRTAMKARVTTNRKRAKERPVAELPQREAAAEEMPEELLGWLDKELIRLPDKYRLPVVCCDLQGLSRKDAANKLGWPIGTLNWRLAKARTLLAKAMTQHGLMLSGGALALALSRHAAHAAISPGLQQLTVRAGKLMLTHSLSAGVVSAKVASLTEGVVKSMFLTKLKMGLMVVIAVAGIGTASGLASYGTFGTGQSESQGQDESAKKSAEEPVKKERQTAIAKHNFQVIAPSAPIAQAIGDAAEKYRRSIALEWFGKEQPPWSKSCPINVRINSVGAAGATSSKIEDEQVTIIRMELEGPLDRLLNASLPHEITHVLFAYHFCAPVPRWADEGAAILSEDQTERLTHEKALELVLSTPGRFIALEKLFAFHDFPKDAAALYSEGYSVTRFLVESENREVFLKFVADGMRNGWEKAARRHYGYDTIAKMEDAWLHSIKGDRAPADLSGPIQSEGKTTSKPAPFGSLQLPDKKRAAKFDAGYLSYDEEGKPSKCYTLSINLFSVGVFGKEEIPLQDLILTPGTEMRLTQKEGVWTVDRERNFEVGTATFVVNIKLGSATADKMRLEMSVQHNVVKTAYQYDTMVVGTSMLAIRNVHLGRQSTIFWGDTDK
ncbi:MAG TPA: RNA polymerase sigma factor, partial [Gemmataceae bacterium]|nr:RNA polymerase sigma factor [Gemmataceae bacterium]